MRVNEENVFAIMEEIFEKGTCPKGFAKFIAIEIVRERGDDKVDITREELFKEVRYVLNEGKYGNITE